MTTKHKDHKEEHHPRLVALEAEKAAIIDRYEVIGHDLAEKRAKELAAVDADIETAKHELKKLGGHHHG